MADRLLAGSQPVIPSHFLPYVGIGTGGAQASPTPALEPMKLGRLMFDREDLSVSVRDRVTNTWYTLLSFRCLCGKLTLGCANHWLCGLCEPCRVDMERDVLS